MRVCKRDTRAERQGRAYAVSGKNRGMELTYDAEDDAAYLLPAAASTPSEKQVVCDVQDGEVIVDIDARGTIIGLEFVCASRILPEEFQRA